MEMVNGDDDVSDDGDDDTNYNNGDNGDNDFDDYDGKKMYQQIFVYLCVFQVTPDRVPVFGACACASM